MIELSNAGIYRGHAEGRIMVKADWVGSQTTVQPLTFMLPYTDETRRHPASSCDQNETHNTQYLWRIGPKPLQIV